jgi:hypothetical protein
VYVQRLDASGIVQWTADGEALCLAPLDQYNPALAADGAGGAIVAWQDLRGGVSTDIYAQRVNAGGTALWAGGGVALCAATGAQVFPAIASDGLGGAVVAWEDARAGANDDIYAQRINGAGTVRWTADGVVVCAAGNYQIVPGIVPDGASGAIVAWTDSRAVTHQDVYAQRMDSSGVAQWAANGVAACAAAGNQGSPVLDADGAGGVALAWYDYRAGATPDLYAQRLSGAGGALWAANGVAVCTAAGLQSSPAISAYGTGGAVVSWLATAAASSRTCTRSAFPARAPRHGPPTVWRCARRACSTRPAPWPEAAAPPSWRGRKSVAGSTTSSRARFLPPARRCGRPRAVRRHRRADAARDRLRRRGRRNRRVAGPAQRHRLHRRVRTAGQRRGRGALDRERRGGEPRHPQPERTRDCRGRRRRRHRRWSDDPAGSTTCTCSAWTSGVALWTAEGSAVRRSGQPVRPAWSRMARAIGVAGLRGGPRRACTRSA